MLRALTCAATLVLLCAVTLLAKEYEGTVTKLDTEKNVVTVKIGDNEKTFAYTDSTEFINAKGKAIKSEKLGKLAEKLANKAQDATLVTSEKDDKEEVKDGNPLLKTVTFKAKKKQ
jgi:hypothetical protein